GNQPRRTIPMRFTVTLAALVLGGGALSYLTTSAADQPVRKKYGLEKRIPWTTSKVIGSPEPPPPYKTERVFPKLTFEEPLELQQAPGTDRLFVAERWGKIYSFVNKPDVKKADLVLEFKPGTDSKGEPSKKVIYSITCHPKFADNGYLYVTWIP